MQVEIITVPALLLRPGSPGPAPGCRGAVVRRHWLIPSHGLPPVLDMVFLSPRLHQCIRKRHRIAFDEGKCMFQVLVPGIDAAINLKFKAALCHGLGPAEPGPG